MARLFNGTTDYIALPAVQFLAADSSVTVSFWNKVTSAQVQAAAAFTIGNSDTPNRCQAHVPYSDSTLYWDYGNSTSGQGRVSTSYAAYLNKWTHVALVFNTATNLHAIYLDGVLKNSHTHANSPGSALTGGRLSHPNFNHKGTLAEFALWSAALTAVQIKALASGAGPFYVAPDGFVGYWPLFGNSPEPDYSKNRNSGTVTGTTVVAHAPVMPGLIRPTIALTTPVPTALTVLPDTGTLTLTGAPPTVTLAAQPTPGTLTALGFAPTTSVSTTPTPATLVLSGLAPTTLVTATPDAATVTLTGLTPTAIITSTADQGVLTLTGFAPDAPESLEEILAGWIATAVTGHTGTAIGGRVRSPSTGSIA